MSLFICFNFWLFINLIDFPCKSILKLLKEFASIIPFRYTDRNYYRRPQRRGNSEGLNFIESVSQNTTSMLLGYLLIMENVLTYCYDVGFLICIWWRWSKSRNWRREMETGNILSLYLVVRWFLCFMLCSKLVLLPLRRVHDSLLFPIFSILIPFFWGLGRVGFFKDFLKYIWSL